MYNKKLLSKAICISATCVLLASNISFADTTKDGQISTNIEIENKYTADKFYELLDTNQIFTSQKEPVKGKEYLNKLKTIADKNKDDKNMQMQYHEHNAYYNREYENRYNTVDELKVAEKFLSDDVAEKLHFYDQLARSYTEVWDFDNAYLAYKNTHKIINKNKNSLETHQIINDYVSRMYFHLGQGELEKAFSLYKEGRNVLDNENEKITTLEINLNEPLIQYYFSTYDMNNVKEAVDYHMELAQEINDIKLKDFTVKTYLNYFRTIKDTKSTKKALKVLDKLNKDYDKNSIEQIYVNIDYADSYLAFAQMYEDDVKYAPESDKYKELVVKNAQKAEKYAQEAVAAAEQYKDVAPTIYALALQKTAKAAAKQGKAKEAEETMAKAIEYFKKANRALSYYLFWGRLDSGLAYKDLGEYEKAIKELNLLEKDLNKALKDPFLEHMSLYDHIAETYSKMNKEKEAIKYINKEIKVSTEKFGADSIRTIDVYKTKVELYENLGLQEKAVKEAKELLFKIKEAGIAPTYDIEFECYFLLAKDYLAKGKLDDALANASKALKTAYTESNKDEANKLISKIYKQQGETLKSLKYKLK